MDSSFRLFKVRGIEIGANWSWLLIFGLIIWTLASVQFPAEAEGLGDATYWVMGIVAGVLFVASLVLHELGHAFRAQREGMTIEGITLWLFGGVAKFKGMFPSAGAEFRIAVAGPVVSLVLAVLFEAGARGGEAIGAPVAVVTVLGELSFINRILLLFNMLPGLPLDGGRVLRSYLWHRNGNYTVATITAARVARVIGGVGIGFGVLRVLSGDVGGFWLAFIGFFLIQAAQAEVSYALFRQSLRGRTVEEVMTPDPEVVDPDTTVEAFLNELAGLRGPSTFPVIEHGQIVGLVSIKLAAAVPATERATQTIREIMVPPDAVPVVAAGDEIVAAAQLMQEGPGRALVVDDDGRISGILSMTDVARAIEFEQLRTPAEPGSKSRGGWLAAVVVGIFLLLAAGYFYAPPFVVFGPGKAFDVTPDIKIEGVDVDEVNGEYLLTSVAVQQPNVYGLLAAVMQGEPLLSLSDVVPPDVDPDEFFKQQEELFKERQRISAAAAARAAGMEVELTGTGARVIAVRDGAPADGRLRPDDVITAVDGESVRLADDLSGAIRSRPPGTSFDMEVTRGDDRTTVTVTSEAGILQGAPAIGVDIDTRDFDVELPFEITFREREIGGPSAGLTYALAVYDLLEDTDTARGRSIATTGEMSIDGLVGAVGGVDQKAIGAKDGGADLFLVPEDEVRLVEGIDLDVIGVRTLEEAIETLT